MREDPFRMRTVISRGSGRRRHRGHRHGRSRRAAGGKRHRRCRRKTGARSRDRQGGDRPSRDGRRGSRARAAPTGQRDRGRGGIAHPTRSDFKTDQRTFRWHELFHDRQRHRRPTGKRHARRRGIAKTRRGHRETSDHTARHGGRRRGTVTATTREGHGGRGSIAAAARGDREAHELPRSSGNGGSWLGKRFAALDRLTAPVARVGHVRTHFLGGRDGNDFAEDKTRHAHGKPVTQLATNKHQGLAGITVNLGPILGGQGPSGGARSGRSRRNLHPAELRRHRRRATGHRAGGGEEQIERPPLQLILGLS